MHPAQDPLVSIAPGAGGLPKLTLTAPDGARVEVYLYGAHVTSWIPAGGEERLFMSRVSAFVPGSPIRGGVPLVWPQFGMSGPLPLHGIVRLQSWELAAVDLKDGRATVTLCLTDSEATRAVWGQAFRTELAVTAGGNELVIALSAANTGAEPFTFTAALHTYLAVQDLAATHVEGLQGRIYRDNAAGGVEVLDGAPQVVFGSELSRLYPNAPAEVRLVDGDRALTSRAAGFTDAVVWNPGAARCATMPDLEPADYLRFVCIETASVVAPVTVAPGERWVGSQTLVG